ncbi:MAG: type II secretion system F family protein [Planctomycetota bacterium]|nr:type II secretion system F family protein [Planctomycetota bacterium]
MARIQRKAPTAARPAARADTGGGEDTVKVKRKVPLKDVVRFTRLLSTLTQAGLPILRSLRILADQWPAGRFRDAVLDTGDMVEEGQTLSDSLAQNPEVFDELYVNMARAGEAGGVLDQVMNRLADFQERAQEIRAKTKSALTYPTVIAVIAVTVITVLMIFVIPTFADLFRDMNLELPALTAVMIAVSEFMTKWWYFVIGVPILLGILHGLLMRRSYGYRRRNHALLLKLPLIGSLTEQSQVSRFASTFGTLIGSGVPHLESFKIVRGALTNEVYRETLETVREEVREGESIAASLGSSGHFDDVVVSMVEVGEETGELDRMCMRVGSSYEEIYTRRLNDLLGLLEPVMLVIMAVLVGAIAFSLFLPIFKLLGEFGKAQ